MLKLKDCGWTLLAAVVLTACAGQADPQTQTQKQTETKEPTVALDTPLGTAKPGAAVNFSHKIDTPAAAGEWAQAELTVTEAYPEGTLRIEVRGEGDIEVAPSSQLMLFDMAGTNEHNWSVRFKANSDGVHFVNLFATAEGVGDLSNRRAYSIRVAVGDVTANQKSDATIDQTEEGETVVIMEAEEKIEQ